MAIRILIVDDSPMNLKVISATLAPSGYEVVLAQNGQEALDQAAALQPDLIILDVIMPDMDGYEVCRRLRRTPAFAQRPIMMLTANDGFHERMQRLEAGADDSMSKPFEPAELQARIRALLRRTIPELAAPLAAPGKVIALYSLQSISLTLPWAPETIVQALNRGIPLITEQASKPIGALLEDWTFLLSSEAQRHKRPERPTATWQRLAQRAQQRRPTR